MGLSDKTKTRRRFRAQKLILLEHGRCNQAYLDLILQTRFHLVLLVPLGSPMDQGETRQWGNDLFLVIKLVPLWTHQRLHAQ